MTNSKWNSSNLFNKKDSWISKALYYGVPKWGKIRNFSRIFFYIVLQKNAKFGEKTCKIQKKIFAKVFVSLNPTLFTIQAGTDKSTE